MISYLIHSTIILSILLLIFLVVIKRARWFAFNRFYLIAALILSISLPLIEIDLSTVKEAQILSEFSISENVSSYKMRASAYTYTDWLLWVYWLVSFIFTVRFVTSFYKQLAVVISAQKDNFSGISIRLVEQEVGPYSFLKSIIINKEAFLAGQVQKEIILHEKSHIKQFHSLDIIFSELLLIFFWFSPIHFLLKSQIQENHEFMVDKDLMNSGVAKKHYQRLLVDEADPQKTRSLRFANAWSFNQLKDRILYMGYEPALYSKLKLGLISFMIFFIMLFTNAVNLTSSAFSPPSAHEEIRYLISIKSKFTWQGRELNYDEVEQLSQQYENLNFISSTDENGILYTKLFLSK